MQRQNDLNNNNAPKKQEEDINKAILASQGITPYLLPAICSSAGFVDLYRRLPLVCKLFNKISKELSQSKILTFIRCKTNQIIDLDKALEKEILANQEIALGYFDLEVSRRENNFVSKQMIKNVPPPVFLKYLQNHFILCHEFFCIPEVKSYLKTTSENLFCSISNINHECKIRMTLKLELSLVVCLLGEVIETSEGKDSFANFIKKNCYSFLTGRPEPNCAADLYNDCRAFIIDNHAYIDPQLIAQFYNCYINHLRRNLEQPTLKKIGELVKEKLEILKGSENQNQTRLNRN